jgi:cellobiose phosphorylase
MYRLIVESLLGLRLEGEQLRIAPVLPPDWKPFTINYRYRETRYAIAVQPTENGETSLAVDGVEQEDGIIRLVDDRQDHAVLVRLPAAVALTAPHER